jgi:hypothetical protein
MTGSVAIQPVFGHQAAMWAWWCWTPIAGQVFALGAFQRIAGCQVVGMQVVGNGFG